MACVVRARIKRRSELQWKLCPLWWEMGAVMSFASVKNYCARIQLAGRSGPRCLSCLVRFCDLPSERPRTPLCVSKLLIAHRKQHCRQEVKVQSKMNRYRAGGPSKATASTLCQKCLKKGHFSYECTASQQDRPYISRPSRTQQLANPKLAPKLANTAPKDEAPK